MTNSPNTARARFWPLALTLSLLCLLTRIPDLLALPIFGDEAIYLRWAQLVDLGHPWVSLCDPKPPLHFWLLAPLITLTANPLLAARLLNVVAGVLAIPLILLACTELANLARRPVSGRLVGILAAILMIFCPFLAFYQRLATADGLFITESLATVWLSLRWARKLAEQKNGLLDTLLLALALGAGLLTRQGLSYTLCFVPPIALLLHCPGRHTKFFRRAGGQLALVAAIAFVVWSPYLLADLHSFAKAGGGVVTELERRILYRSDFTKTTTPRSTILARNFALTFIPSTAPAGTTTPVPDSGWLFFYLTPPVYLATLLGLIYLALRKQWRLLVFLLAWLALMLVPPIILGDVIFSRYVLAGVPPLLFAAAFLLADALAFIVSRKIPALVRWPCAALVLAGLLLASLRQIADQIAAPDRQILTAQDRYQYITGWTAGLPTLTAIDALTHLAATRPIVVITGPGWGTPADAVWVYLAGNPNVSLYYTIPVIDGPLLLTPAPPPVKAGTFLLRKNKFLFTPPEPVTIPSDVPIFYITADTPDQLMERILRRSNANLGPRITFYGMEGRAAPDHVVIFPLHRPHL